MRIGHFEWSVDAVRYIIEALIGFMLFEIGQQGSPVPSACAAERIVPTRIIGRYATRVGHCIHRTAPAKDMALHDVHGAAVKGWLRLGFVD
jgi:hypothetical protein